MNDKEKWRPVGGYVGYYEVSNIGRVRSVDRLITYKDGRVGKFIGKVLKSGANKKGYPIVYLSKNSKKFTVTIHRLVAMAFIKKIDGKNQVNHIDGIKDNNNVTNLEWCNNSENQLHAFRNGLKTPERGSDRYNSVINELTAKKVKKLLLRMSANKVSIKTGVSIHIVKDILRNRSWRHV